MSPCCPRFTRCDRTAARRRAASPPRWAIRGPVPNTGAEGPLEQVPEGSEPSDSLESHIFDTIKGSDWLGDQDAIEIMINDAPRVIYEYEHMGCVFSRTPDGRVNQRRFGGHSAPRACFAADWTGHVLLHTVHEQALRHGVKFYSEWYCLDLIVEDDICRGVVAMNILTGEIHTMRAKAVMFGTGGYGRAFKITSNAHANTGDGVAIAYNAGVPLMDMEFVQFHPTGLYKHGILMSEACRGEGGYLVNSTGERFMERYAKSKMELAPRDLVSRSEQQEINEGRGGEADRDAIYLDLRHLGREKILQRLPQVRELAIDFVGTDPIDKLVPIQPTAHYSMGGIPCDANGQVIADAQGTPVVGILRGGRMRVHQRARRESPGHEQPARCVGVRATIGICDRGVRQGRGASCTRSRVIRPSGTGSASDRAWTIPARNPSTRSPMN